MTPAEITAYVMGLSDANPCAALIAHMIHKEDKGNGR